MRIASVIVRVLLGFGFVAAGVAFFAMTPPELPEGPMKLFTNGMAATGYFFYLLKITEIACGLMLLSGFFVPLALVVLAPILLNIFLIHAFLDPQGLIPSLVLGFSAVFLAFFSPQYSPKIKALFQPK